MEPARGPDGHRRVGLADFGERSLLIKVFVAVPVAGRNPPGRRRLRNREFGQLVDDRDVSERRLFRKFVAEADAVVVGAEDDVQATSWRRFLDEADAELVVAVAHEPSLAPGLFPGFIRASLFLALEAEAALELRGIRQDETQPRFRDYDRATPADRIARPAVRVEHDRHRELAIRGCDFSDRFRGCDATDRAEGGDQDYDGHDSHGGEANRTGKPADGCKRFHALQSYAFIAGGGGRPLGSMRPAGSAPFAYGGRKSWNSRAFHATCCAWRSPPRYRQS